MQHGVCLLMHASTARPGSSSDDSKVQVEEIMLLNTTVRRWDGVRCYYPTAMLNAAPLLNLSRSENHVEAFKVCPCPGSLSAQDLLSIRRHDKQKTGAWNSNPYHRRP